MDFKIPAYANLTEMLNVNQIETWEKDVKGYFKYTVKPNEHKDITLDALRIIGIILFPIVFLIAYIILSVMQDDFQKKVSGHNADTFCKYIKEAAEIARVDEEAENFIEELLVEVDNSRIESPAKTVPITDLIKEGNDLIADIRVSKEDLDDLLIKIDRYKNKIKQFKENKAIKSSLKDQQENSLQKTLRKNAKALSKAFGIDSTSVLNNLLKNITDIFDKKKA